MHPNSLDNGGDLNVKTAKGQETEGGSAKAGVFTIQGELFETGLESGSRIARAVLLQYLRKLGHVYRGFKVGAIDYDLKMLSGSP